MKRGRSWSALRLTNISYVSVMSVVSVVSYVSVVSVVSVTSGKKRSLGTGVLSDSDN